MAGKAMAEMEGPGGRCVIAGKDVERYRARGFKLIAERASEAEAPEETETKVSETEGGVLVSETTPAEDDGGEDSPQDDAEAEAPNRPSASEIEKMTHTELNDINESLELGLDLSDMLVADKRKAVIDAMYDAPGE